MRRHAVQSLGWQRTRALQCLGGVQAAGGCRVFAAPLSGGGAHPAVNFAATWPARSSATARGFATTADAAVTVEEDLRAQEYYDSEDAFNFYKEVWGGENIHVGLYPPGADAAAQDTASVRAAAADSLAALYAKRPPPTSATVMDMGSAYGGNARYAVRTYGARVSCVDVSAKENERNRELTAEAGMSDRIWINGERSFTATGEPAGTFDLVVSQDSFLHAGQHREQAIAEASRVLKPGGYLVFTDIMQSDDCDVEQMESVLARIHLDDMGSPRAYKQWGVAAGLEFEEFDDCSYQLAAHYNAVKQVMLSQHAAGRLAGKVSAGFVERMSAGLQSWVDHSARDNLAWGYMVFRKP